MGQLRRFFNDESNAFVIEVGLLLTLIVMVIALRVIQFSSGA